MSDVEALQALIGAHEAWAGGQHCTCQEADDDGRHDPLPVYWDQHFAEVLAAYVAAERDRAVREALAPVRALAEEWERLRADDTLAYASRYIADLRAALPDDREEEA